MSQGKSETPCAVAVGAPGSAVEGLKARLDAEQMDYGRAVACGCSICRCWRISADAIEAAEQQEARAERCVGLLKAAHCPDATCDRGTVLRTVTVAACCNQPTETGECCGNPVPEQEQVPEQCQWCYERDAAIKQEQAP